MCAYVTRAFQYANDDFVTACWKARVMFRRTHSILTDEHINTLTH